MNYFCSNSKTKIRNVSLATNWINKVEILKLLKLKWK